MKLKKVKIDDHIRASKKSNSDTPKRKRGRPRKDSGFNQAPENGAGIDNSSSILSDGAPLSENIGDIEREASQVQPQYDTTEEAKAFLRSPFDMAAGITGIKKLSLYPEQLEALAPSFKVVYDKRILPSLGENADLIAFTVAASGIIFEKVSVFREYKQSLENQKPQNTDSAGVPYIPTEHIV